MAMTTRGAILISDPSGSSQDLVHAIEAITMRYHFLRLHLPSSAFRIVVPGDLEQKLDGQVEEESGADSERPSGIVVGCGAIHDVLIVVSFSYGPPEQGPPDPEQYHREEVCLDDGQVGFTTTLDGQLTELFGFTIPLGLYAIEIWPDDTIDVPEQSKKPEGVIRVHIAPSQASEANVGEELPVWVHGVQSPSLAVREQDSFVAEGKRLVRAFSAFLRTMPRLIISLVAAAVVSQSIAAVIPIFFWAAMRQENVLKLEVHPSITIIYIFENII